MSGDDTGDSVDRDRIDRIAQHVRNKLDAANTALNAGDPREAGIMLRDGYYLLDIAAELAGSPAVPETPALSPTSSHEQILEHLRRWEAGEEFPSRTDRRIIARAFDVPEERLFLDDEASQ